MPPPQATTGCIICPKGSIYQTPHFFFACACVCVYVYAVCTLVFRLLIQGLFIATVLHLTCQVSWSASPAFTRILGSNSGPQAHRAALCPLSVSPGGAGTLTLS